MEAENKGSHFIYQDEVGYPKSGKYFITGIMIVKNREEAYHDILSIRSKHNYWGVMHFIDLAKKTTRRARVFKGSINKVFSKNVYFRAFYIDNYDLDLTRFDENAKISKRRKKTAEYKAYNFITKELVVKSCKYFKFRNAIVYTHRRVRAKRDNLYKYLPREVNKKVGYRAINKMEPRKSEEDDLIQLTDIVLGCINNILTFNKQHLKVLVRKEMEKYLGLKIRFEKYKLKKIG